MKKSPSEFLNKSIHETAVTGKLIADRQDSGLLKLSEMSTMRKNIAEFLGTYILVFTGTGAIVINNVTEGVVSHPGIAITFGLVVMALIYALGDVSGAHINPAVSVSFLVTGDMKASTTFWYILFQCAGAIAASLTLRVLFWEQEKLGGTLPAGPWWQSFILEFLLTFILMFVVLQVATGAKEKGIMAGIAIGGVVALEAMFAGPICGASMNPARSLGPAVVSGHLEHLWIYLVATTLGAVAAVPVWKLLQTPEPDSAPL